MTGAASGMGRASALMFAKQGAKVLVADVNVAEGEKTVEAIIHAGAEACFARTDVSSDADVAAAVKVAADRWGGIDILMNNAAATALCNHHDRGVHELPEAVWDKMSRRHAQECLPLLQALSAFHVQKKGVIINVTSCDAILPEAGFDSYTAAKGGVISITKAMAVNYGARRSCQLHGPRAMSSPKPINSGIRTTSRWWRRHMPCISRPASVRQMTSRTWRRSWRPTSGFVTGAVTPCDGGFQIYKPSMAQTLCRDDNRNQ